MGQLTKLRSTIPLILICFFLAFGLSAQNVSVTGSTSVDGTYATLGDAFTAINGEAQTSKTILVSITGNTTETATATLNNKGWKSLSISPAGAYTISGNIAGALIQLKGDTAVTIDGLNTAGNSLKIENKMTGAASTISFTDDCKNILVQNTSILGSSSSANYGTVFFGSAVASGNDNIKINACAIDSSSAGLPVNGVCSIGSIAANQENSNNTIINSYIANYFNDTTASSGVYLGAGNTAWTISGNRFYQSSKRTYTVAKTHTAINVTSGNAHSIVNNIIGYANAGGTNAYEMTSTVGIRFIGIDIAAGSAAVSSIQGNTITAIKLTTASNDVANYGAFCAIRASAGDVNIGTISGNTIGSNTGVDFITLSSTNPAALVGINAASTDTVNINKNIIGGLSSISPTVTVGPVVYGIAVTASAAALNISGNIIGNTTVNNIRAGSTSTTVASSIAYGITFSTTPSSTVISENTIQNVISYGISSSSVRGITTASAAGNTSSIIIAKNTITNLRTNGTLPNILSGQSAANGISLSIGTNNIVENNTISHIYNTTVEAVFTYAVGIAHANATNTIIRNNTIFDITNTSTSTSTTQPGVAAGILIRSATNAVNVYNNMISLGTSSDANTAFVGIQLNNAAAPDPTIQNIFHNTVNIEGTVTSGAQPSFCFYRGDFSVTAKNLNATVKNNIFTNSRSGGTGSHFAIANNYGATVNASNWISDYNVLNATASTIGYWGANKTFSDWKTSSGSDTNSYSGYAIPYVNPATDLHLNTGTTGSIVESRGQSGLTILSDIDGDVRPGPVGSTNGGGTAPDIGADEIDGVVYDFIPPAITYTAFTGTCDTTSRTLAVKIIDSGKVYITGPLLPKIYFRKNKNAWVSAQGILSSGTAKNGNWSFTISTSALGGLAANDTVSYFVIAQDLTGNITAQPSAGVIASDVNTVTSYPTTPDQYRINPTPLVLTPKGGAVCDSGKVTLTASSNYGKLYWYTVPSGGSAVDTGKTFTTPIIKATTPYYVEVIANNCISARLQVDAIVNHSTKGLPIIQTACDSLKWNGVYVKTSGTYYDTLTNSKGCDSILTLQLTITHGTSHQDTVKACGPYTWNGHTYTTSGVYKDTLATKAGCDSIVTLQLTITNLNATVTVLANLLTADSLVDSYQWIDCGTKLPISGATNKIFIALTSGTYAVIETKNGCVDTSNCIPVIITGIATNEQDQLYAYPNPGNGNYTLVLPDKANVKVVSLTGEIVFDAQLPKGTNTIELINAANGVYIMHVSTASSHQVVRLIKQD